MCVLEVDNIIILGHSHCAGVKTLVDADGLNESDFIRDWVDIARPAKDKVLANNPDADADSLYRACEREAILLSLQNLLTFPWIAERVRDNKLKLYGWYFSIIDGSLQQYDSETKSFHPIPADS